MQNKPYYHCKFENIIIQTYDQEAEDIIQNNDAALKPTAAIQTSDEKGSKAITLLGERRQATCDSSKSLFITHYYI